MCRDFARAIEAEVLKRDEALIRQLVEALEATGAITTTRNRVTQSEQAVRGLRARAVLSCRPELDADYGNPIVAEHQ